MKNKNSLWKRRIAGGLCMTLLAMTMISPISLAAEATSLDLSDNNISLEEPITNAGSNILYEDSDSSAISTESSISSEVSSQSNTDDPDDADISSGILDSMNPSEHFEDPETAETEVPAEDPEATEAETETPAEDPEATEAETETPAEDPEATDTETEAPAEDPEATEAETEAPAEELEVATPSEANPEVQPQPLKAKAPQPAMNVNGIFIVTNDDDDTEIGQYDTLLDASLAASEAMVTDHLGDSYTITVTQDYDETDSVISTEVGMNLTVTSTPGEQFVLTRKLAGPPWAFAASPRHFVLGDKGTLTLKNIILDGDNKYGGLYQGGESIITLSEGAVIRNCVGRGTDPSTPWHGGAITMIGNGHGADLFLEDGSRIENCKTIPGYDGGAIYVGEGTRLYMDGGVIEGCEAIGSKNTGNDRHSDGGAIMIHGFMEMTDGTISNNKTTSSGGGIAVSSSGTLSVRGGIIEGNNGAFGGGIYLNEHVPKTKIENTSFTGNTAKYGGGVYLHETAALDVSDSSFSKNFAIQGGAIYTGNYSYDDPADTTKYQSITLADSVTFTENTASKGLYNPPQNADAFTNLCFAKTSVTDTNLIPMDSLLTNYDINYIHGDPVDTSAKYQVTFKFISLTNDASGQPKPLPQEVLGLLPSPMTNLKKGDMVTYPILNLEEVPVSDGKWIFNGWTGGTGTTINGNVQEVGGWIFDKTADMLYYPTMGIYIDGERIDVPQDGSPGSNANLPEAFKNVGVTFGSVTRTFSSDTVGTPGFPLTIKFTDYPDSGFTEGVYPYEVKNIPEGYTYEMIAKDHIVDGGIKVDGTLGNMFVSFTRISTPPTVANLVNFNVHTLVNGTEGFANKEILEQMNPVLQTENGQEVKPVRIADNGFTFDFENVPAGEYTLAFTYPAGYDFAPGKVGSDMFGDYLDTGTKVTVIAGNVVNSFYTRLEKDSDGSNPPVDPPIESTGNLTVSKKVSGSGGDQNKEFTFTVTMDKKDLIGQYGDMTFSNGVATFTLKHGQNKTATGLPTGVSYTVDESDNKGYTVTKTNATGKIQNSITAIAAFENYKSSSIGSGGSSSGSGSNFGSSSGGSGSSSGGNSHTPQAAHVTLTATKTLDSLIPTGSSFTFFLDDANGQRMQIKNNQSGNITFDTLTFKETGTYVYYLTEQTGDDKNINYDTALYKATITVTCPYDYAASVSYEKNGQAYQSIPSFANTTKPSAPALTQTPPVVTPDHSLDNVPKTEDSSNPAIWGILAAASFLSLIVLLAGYKKHKGHF